MTTEILLTHLGSPGLIILVWEPPFLLQKISKNALVGLVTFWLGLLRMNPSLPVIH
jgi:hypothetical protein